MVIALTWSPITNLIVLSIKIQPLSEDGHRAIIFDERIPDNFIAYTSTPSGECGNRYVIQGYHSKPHTFIVTNQIGDRIDYLD